MSHSLDTAIDRQDLISYKVTVTIAFSEYLGELTNVVDTDNPENDPSYLASIEVLSDVTTDTQTVTIATG